MEFISEIAQKPSQKSAEQTKNVFEKRYYDIADTRVYVSWKEFSPQNKEVPSDEAILFLSGWSAGKTKTLENLTQSFAQDSGKNAFLIITKSKKVVDDSLYKEAQAIREAIREMVIGEGLKKIILAAHSEGGIKAANLISMLQEENQNNKNQNNESQNVEIQGLILLDPVGLYEQNGGKLASQFTLDTVVNTPATLVKNSLRDPSLILKGLQAGSDIIFNIARGIATTSLKDGTYVRRLILQIKEGARKNTHYQEIECPIVLIQGKKDPISDYKKIIPNINDPEDLWEREKILKETLFLKSKSVVMLLGEKIGHHGLPHFRPEAVSQAALRALRLRVSPTKIPS